MFGFGFIPFGIGLGLGFEVGALAARPYYSYPVVYPAPYPVYPPYRYLY